MKDYETLEEMAQDLPGEVGLSPDGKSRLLCVMEILKTFTNKDEGLTADEIAAILAFRSGVGPDDAPTQQTVIKDIHAIKDNKPQGLEIYVPSRGQSGGYRCMERNISSAEARLLINIVKTCKFITKKQSNELCDALASLVSYSEQDAIVEDVYIDEAERPEGIDVFKVADIAAQCIREKRKICFDYVYYGVDGKFHELDANGVQRYEETPVNLVFSHGYYYLETATEVPEPYATQWGKQYEMSSRRLDRMRNVEMSSAKGAKGKEVSSIRKTVKERTRQTFDGYGGSRPARNVFLRVQQGAASNMVFNRYGSSVKFEHRESGMEGDYATIWIQAKLGPTFFRWVFSMGESVKIVPPPNSLALYVGSWKKRAESVDFEQLEKDYRAAKEGFVDCLAKVMEQYDC